MMEILKDKTTLSLNPKLYPSLSKHAFVKEFTDIINYRTMDYYRRRYENKTE